MLPDRTIEDPSKVTSVILCTGKVRWDLVSRRGQAGKKAAWRSFRWKALPLPAKQLANQLASFDNVHEIRWVKMSRLTRAPGPSWH